MAQGAVLKFNFWWLFCNFPSLLIQHNQKMLEEIEFLQLLQYGPPYTANIFPVMVTGFPCVHLFPCRPPVPPTGIPCYLMNRGIPVIILHVLHVTCKSLFALRGLTCYHTTSTSICFTDKAVLILQGFSCYSDRQKIVSWTGIWLQI